jgi:hypothetical protein
MKALLRRLAQTHPEAFLHDLAQSLNNLGHMQSELGQHEAALATAEEALEAIWPFFLRLSAAFERNTGIMLDNLLKRLDALGRPSPLSLVERVATFLALRTAGTPPPG